MTWLLIADVLLLSWLVHQYRLLLTRDEIFRGFSNRVNSVHSLFHIFVNLNNHHLYLSLISVLVHFVNKCLVSRKKFNQNNFKTDININRCYFFFFVRFFAKRRTIFTVLRNLYHKDYVENEGDLRLCFKYTHLIG